MSTLDHNFYPHIIDQIWAYLDYDGHKAVRLVCKQWRERADKVDHLWIVRTNDELQIRKRHPHDLDSWSPFLVVTTFPPARDAYWQMLVKNLGTLDLSNAFFTRDQRVWILSWTSKVPLIRNEQPFFMPPLCRERPPMLCMTQERQLIFQDIDPGEFVSVWIWQGLYDPRHIVLTANCSADPTDAASRLRAQSCIWDDDLDQTFTIILKDTRPTRTATANAKATEYAYDFMLDWMTTVGTYVCVEVVGLELFIPAAGERKKLEGELRRRMVERLAGEVDEEDLEERWSFLTHKAYRSLVGERDYLLFTADHGLCNKTERRPADEVEQRGEDNSLLTLIMTQPLPRRRE